MDFGLQSHGFSRTLKRDICMLQQGVAVRKSMIVHGVVDVAKQILFRSGHATRQSEGQHHNTNFQTLKNCYRVSFFPGAFPKWNHLPRQIRLQLALLLLTVSRPSSCVTNLYMISSIMISFVYVTCQ